ncbi:hypothetical protein V1511DRAFT_491454 [Dipodascopsis uninucleata]
MDPPSCMRSRKRIRSASPYSSGSSGGDNDDLVSTQKPTTASVKFKRRPLGIDINSLLAGASKNQGSKKMENPRHNVQSEKYMNEFIETELKRRLNGYNKLEESPISQLINTEGREEASISNDRVEMKSKSYTQSEEEQRQSVVHGKLFEVEVRSSGKHSEPISRKALLKDPSKKGKQNTTRVDAKSYKSTDLEKRLEEVLKETSLSSSYLLPTFRSQSRMAFSTEDEDLGVTASEKNKVMKELEKNWKYQTEKQGRTGKKN